MQLCMLLPSSDIQETWHADFHDPFCTVVPFNIACTVLTLLMRFKKMFPEFCCKCRMCGRINLPVMVVHFPSAHFRNISQISFPPTVPFWCSQNKCITWPITQLRHLGLHFSSSILHFWGFEELKIFLQTNKQKQTKNSQKSQHQRD